MLITETVFVKITNLVKANQATMARPNNRNERDEIKQTLNIVQAYLNHVEIVPEDRCYCEQVHPDRTCGYCLSKQSTEEPILVF